MNFVTVIQLFTLVIVTIIFILLLREIYYKTGKLVDRIGKNFFASIFSVLLVIESLNLLEYYETNVGMDRLTIILYLINYACSVLAFLFSASTLELVIDGKDNSFRKISFISYLIIGISYFIAILILNSRGQWEIAPSDVNFSAFFLILTVVFWCYGILMMIIRSSPRNIRFFEFVDLKKIFVIAGAFAPILVMISIFNIGGTYFTNIMFILLFGYILYRMMINPSLDFLDLQFLNFSMLTPDGIEIYSQNLSNNPSPFHGSLISNWFAAITSVFSEFTGDEILPEVFQFKNLNFTIYWGKKWVYLLASDISSPLYQSSLDKLDNQISELDIKSGYNTFMLSEDNINHINSWLHNLFYYVPKSTPKP